MDNGQKQDSMASLHRHYVALLEDGLSNMDALMMHIRVGKLIVSQEEKQSISDAQTALVNLLVRISK